jgi:hypothetical protein
MKMLTIICRQPLEDEVIGLFTRTEVQGYTVISNLRGTGKTGVVPGPHSWSGLNSLVLAVMPDDLVEQVVSGLRSLHDQRAQERHGHEVPLKLFVQTCEMVL